VLRSTPRSYRYRRISSQTERQQTKWAVLGLIWWSVLVVAEGGP
jgi:type II secretory pathway component PulK